MRAVFATSVLLALTTLAHGQSPVTWTVTPGFEGLYQANAWTPITVQVTNTGPAARGQLVVPTGEAAAAPGSVVPSGPATYTLPVELPRQARKQFSLCVPASGIGAVYLKLGAGAAKQELPPTAKQLGADDELLVVIGGEGNAVSLLNGTSVAAPDGYVKTSISITKSATGSGMQSSSSGGSGQLTLRLAVAHVPWQDLPESWLAWDGVGVAVLADGDLSLASPAAVEALAQWVRLGGTLVVPGGAAGAALAGTPLGSLLPMTVAGTTAAPDLSQLGGWTGQAAPPGPVLLARGQPRPGARVLLGQLSDPLVFSWRVGSGRVIMPLFDYTANPVKYWAGQERLWGMLLSAGEPPGPVRRLEGQFNPQGGFSNRFAQTLPQNRPASQGLLLGFLLVYAVVLSPVQYFVLRRLRRTDLTWVITPAIVAFFCVVAFGLTTGMRGREAILTRLAVIATASGSDSGRGQGWVGVFSPAAKRYTLALGQGVAGARLPADQQEGGRPTMMMGTPPQVKGFAVDMWALRTCAVDYRADLGGGVEIAEAGWDGRTVQLQVRNKTRYTFSDCRVVCEGRVSKLGPVAPGADLRGTFSLALPTTIGRGGPVGGPPWGGMRPGLPSGMPPMPMGPSSPFGPSPGSSSAPTDPVEIMVSALAESTNPASGGGSRSSSSGGSGYSYSYGTTSSRQRHAQAYLVAVTSSPLLPVELVGSKARVRDFALVVLPIEVRLKAGQTVKVPDWMIEHHTLSKRPGRQRTSTVWSSGSGSRTTVRQITRTEQEQTTVYDVPLAPQGGTLTALDVSGQSSPTSRLRVFNQQTGAWDGPPPGLRSQLWQVSAPAPYMDRQGRLLVREVMYDPSSGMPAEITATVRSGQGDHHD